MITAKPRPIMTIKETYANNITKLLEEQGLIDEEEQYAFKQFITEF